MNDHFLFGLKKFDPRYSFFFVEDRGLALRSFSEGGLFNNTTRTNGIYNAKAVVFPEVGVICPFPEGILPQLPRGRTINGTNRATMPTNRHGGETEYTTEYLLPIEESILSNLCGGG